VSATISSRTFLWHGRIAFRDAAVECKYTWRDLPWSEPYGPRFFDGRLIGLIPCDADRNDLPFPITSDVAEQVQLGNIGGLLLWNATLNEEGGTLIMFTGQTVEQERIVVHNAGWWTSCGLTYRTSPGMTHQRPPDDTLEFDGGTWHLIYLDNDYEVGW